MTGVALTASENVSVTAAKRHDLRLLVSVLLFYVAVVDLLDPEFVRKGLQFSRTLLTPLFF